MEVLSQNVSPLQLQSWGRNVTSHILAPRTSSEGVRTALTLLNRVSSTLSLTSEKSNEAYPTGTERQTAISILFLALMTNTSPARNMEGIVREFGVNMYTLLYLKWITNKDLLYSTGNSAQCYVAVWMGEDFGGEWIHVHVRLSPFAVHLRLLIGYTPVYNKKFF